MCTARGAVSLVADLHVEILIPVLSGRQLLQRLQGVRMALIGRALVPPAGFRFIGSTEMPYK